MRGHGSAGSHVAVSRAGHLPIPTDDSLICSCDFGGWRVACNSSLGCDFFFICFREGRESERASNRGAVLRGCLGRCRLPTRLTSPSCRRHRQTVPPRPTSRDLPLICRLHPSESSQVYDTFKWDAI